jgi:hypothetical protein
MNQQDKKNLKVVLTAWGILILIVACIGALMYFGDMKSPGFKVSNPLPEARR